MLVYLEPDIPARFCFFKAFSANGVEKAFELGKLVEETVVVFA